jgi:hypothetical protein
MRRSALLLLAAIAIAGCSRAGPPSDTNVARALQQLQEPGRADAALHGLLRREDALQLGYFHTESTRFSVERVTEVAAPDGTWRLVEAAYLSRIADRSRGGELRARWPVAYVFDPGGRLRDWVHDYDVAILEDVNRDEDLELVAYLDSPKRVIVYSCGRGRSRELLRVDEVPEHGDLIRSVPGEHGGEYQIREKPVALIDDNNPKAPRRLKVANHGIYRWDDGQQRYVRER